MNVSFVYDDGNADGSKGGAELTMEGFAARCPAEVAFTDLEEAETVVIGNCVQFGPDLIPKLVDKRVIRYHHDLARHESPVLRAWIDENAEHVFTSPLHRHRYGVQWDHGTRDCHVIPPALDLDRFRPNRQARRHPDRAGACSVASWQNPGKGGQLVAAWAAENGPLSVFGDGGFLPSGPNTVWHGEVEQVELPQILQGFERFVFLPLAPEPFGRCVVEAWAAGCELVVNENIGGLWFIREHPEKLESAGEDFWGLILHG